MTTNIPTELMRTFVAVVESGTMLEASKRINVTPSAVSLQIKRLEEIVATPLFFRDTRKLTVTSAGETLLDYARSILALNDEAVDMLLGERSVGQINIGMVEDFAGTAMVKALRLYAAMNPDTRFNLRICGSRELRDLVQSNRLDLALLMSAADDPQAVTRKPVHWFGEQHLVERRVLPLALLEAPCQFRETAMRALEAAERPYEIVVETTSASALHAAIEAGLGVAPRTDTFIAQRPHSRVTGLPPLGEVGYAVIGPALASRGTGRLRKLLDAALKDM